MNFNSIAVAPVGPSYIADKKKLADEEIKNIYKWTTAYSLNNRNKQYSLIFNENSIKNRLDRWWNEEFLIIPQNIYEKFNNSLTILVFLLSLIVIIYVYHNDLIFINSTINDLSSLDDEKIENYIKKENNWTDKEFNKNPEKQKLINDKKTQLLALNDNKLYTYNNLKQVCTGFQIVSCIYLTVLTTVRFFNRTTI